MPHRKKPFSAKQKKEQLQAKREKKRNQETDEFGYVTRETRADSHASKVEDADDSSNDEASVDVSKLNQQPVPKAVKKYDPNKYRLHFASETRAEIKKRTDFASRPFEELPEVALEADIDEIYRPGTVLDLPKRPQWDYTMNKDKLDAKEEAYFMQYLENILEKHTSEELSYFELNLETWRQLWRVVEMADIVLLITDIRHPALHFSPAFHDYITKELGKPLILVLNKIDLVPPSIVVAWRHYFKLRYPDLEVICFTSFPKDKCNESTSDPGKVLHKRRKKRAFSAVGPKQLLNACEEIVKSNVDLTSWREKIEGDIAGVEPEHEVEIRMEEVKEFNKNNHERYRDGMLTIGCCGYTNVGKSSLMNGLMGKKVVSVSKTPGHTKHFQTIYLTPTVKMCDCPGLVFPSLVPKPMQILAGIYPIAQVREPYTTIRYLAERLPLVDMLKIQHPEYDGKQAKEGKSFKWSAMDICDAWAEKRGFLTARVARHDVYRAANHILRLAVDCRICLCTRPPGYTKQKDEWERHKETQEISALQKLHQPSSGLDDLADNFSDLDDDDGAQEEEASDEDAEEDGKEARAVATSNPFDLLGDD